MMSLRMTGSGEPTTTTEPSFFAAASVCSHSFCCANAPVGSRPKTVSSASVNPIRITFFPPIAYRLQPSALSSQISRHRQDKSSSDQHDYRDDCRDQQAERRGALDFPAEAVF